ncbi:hypothetical protein N0B16_08425 [Chryseobacterium sp. GMJ5]|uniref:Lipoprotein n=1 Tax=Chryseobacterium gilvum TaxID=2976534 RepID=A0ABT2VWU7_9FLAO|nr:hypothetical protein [Chryseobacterium gilvum]MCU7614463.1 hypothetical protein [Chryseobacterium gilvum]
MKIFYVSLFFISPICLFKCQNSYTPAKLNKDLSTFTKSKLVLQSEITTLVSIEKCKYLIKARSYAAPIGFTAKKDVKNAAKGIDEWVELDKGNTYILTNYKWVTIDNYGTAQLYVDFDTLDCIN